MDDAFPRWLHPNDWLHAGGTTAIRRPVGRARPHSVPLHYDHSYNCPTNSPRDNAAVTYSVVLQYRPLADVHGGLQVQHQVPCGQRRRESRRVLWIATSRANAIKFPLPHRRRVRQEVDQKVWNSVNNTGTSDPCTAPPGDIDRGVSQWPAVGTQSKRECNTAAA